MRKIIIAAAIALAPFAALSAVPALMPVAQADPCAGLTDAMGNDISAGCRATCANNLAAGLPCAIPAGARQAPAPPPQDPQGPSPCSTSNNGAVGPCDQYPPWMRTSP